MFAGSLTSLQCRVLRALIPMTPPWTLSGGAALVGFHCAYRTTRDLDLVWHGESTLGRAPAVAALLLREEGLQVQAVQRSPSLVQLRVSDGLNAIVVDLFADPIGPVETHLVLEWEGVSLRATSAHELLVNKLCALLGRSELRDLRDVRALLQAGGDLEQALLDAPSKDGGLLPPDPSLDFSPS